MKRQLGLSLVEVVIAMGFFLILSTLITVRTFTARGRAFEKDSMNQLISDLRNQQIRAMGGDSNGIFFESTRYVLFRGTAFNPQDQGNLAVPLEENLQIVNVSFPQATVVFTKGTGEILGFVSGSDALSIRNSLSGEEKRVRLNRYGVAVALD